MDKIFGSWSWWPWSQQQVTTTTVASPFHRSAAVTAAAANIFMSSSSSPFTASSTTATVATTSIPTTNFILKAASSSNSPTSESQPFIVSTATTIAAALSSFIQNDILGNGSSTTSLMGSSTSATMDPFGNDTLFDNSDFTEDELLFRMIWSNATADGGVGSGVDLLLERNVTNGTHGIGADMDYENTWHLVQTIATALILGFIILATVIGKWLNNIIIIYSLYPL